MLTQIFDPFRRAAGGYARRGGLGLGLFITKSIIEAHGGEISVRSDERGTVFAFALPRLSPPLGR
jgi:signal transduction histidine kinase